MLTTSSPFESKLKLTEIFSVTGIRYYFNVVNSDGGISVIIAFFFRKVSLINKSLFSVLASNFFFQFRFIFSLLSSDDNVASSFRLPGHIVVKE